jgi:hypothetical protein
MSPSKEGFMWKMKKEINSGKGMKGEAHRTGFFAQVSTGMHQRHEARAHAGAKFPARLAVLGDDP